MPLSQEEVEHVARLAHIGLQPDEVAALTVQLSSILAHVARLEGVDVEGIEPTSHALPMSNVMSDDIVVNSWSVTAVLANAPQQRNGHFEVQAVLE